MNYQDEILNTDISFLKGVGPVKAELLKKELNIFTFGDLLYYFPFRYLDKTKFQSTEDFVDEKTYYQLKCKVISKQIIKGANRKIRLHVIARDEDGPVELIWFQGVKWIESSIEIDKEYIFFGKMEAGQLMNKMYHPEIESVENNKKKYSGAFYPMYYSTEKLTSAHLTGKNIGKITENLISQLQNRTITETLPEYIIAKYKLLDLKNSLVKIHFPTNLKELESARLRMKFEELFFMQFKMIFNKSVRERKLKGLIFDKVGNKFQKFYHENLTFELTNAQKRVIKEIRKEIGSGAQMNRLLQGDVGSGKTIVALLISLIAIDNGYQVCIMAPTEILAQQHFNNISNLITGLNLNIAFLSGSVKGKVRNSIMTGISEGYIDILIGTHALIESNVVFKKLGLAVIDEQHRFGVKQRASLWSKNKNLPPHVLVMTATPIPRTLAMTVYGDLEVSVIDELPPGRKEITTLLMYDSQRMRLIRFLQSEIQQGRQVYFVFPLIEESENFDMKNLQEGYESLLEYFPRPEYQLGVVHGKMKPADKDMEMNRFKAGITQILVSTTVIEVGVDVPNASVMVIENAERFGLSQLHQLRGRVGRGSSQSYCILMTKYKSSKESKERLKVMTESTNGFYIAEADLKLRGPGDIEGLRQSGLLDLKIASLIEDEKILRFVRELIIKILEKDPHLSVKENDKLKDYVIRNKSLFTDWSRIS